MFRMTDEKGGDDKVLCVPGRRPAAGAPARHPPPAEFDRLEIQHFFEVYKDLEPGKSVEGATWVGPHRGRGRGRALLQALPRRDRERQHRALRQALSHHRARQRKGVPPGWEGPFPHGLLTPSRAAADARRRSRSRRPAAGRTWSTAAPPQEPDQHERDRGGDAADQEHPSIAEEKPSSRGRASRASSSWMKRCSPGDVGATAGHPLRKPALTGLASTFGSCAAAGTPVGPGALERGADPVADRGEQDRQEDRGTEGAAHAAGRTSPTRWPRPCPRGGTAFWVASTRVCMHSRGRGRSAPCSGTGPAAGVEVKPRDSSSATPSAPYR